MKRIVLWSAIWALICAGLFAQNADDILSIRILPAVDRFIPGENHPIALVIEIQAPYHINSESPLEDFLVPTSIALSGPAGAVFSSPEFPEPETRSLSFSDLPLEIYEGSVTVFCDVTLPADFASPEFEIAGLLEYQACDDNACLPPAELAFQEIFAAAGGGESAQPLNQEIFSVRPVESRPVQTQPQEDMPAQEDAPARAGEARSLGDRSLFITFVLVFLGGLGLNLTPCVYPIIPITIGYFGGQSGGKRGGIVAHAILYVLGMAVTYSTLGLVAALTGSLFGAALQNPFVLIGIALVMVALALSMFDLYEFRLPTFLTRMAGGRKRGYLGTMFMGLTVGFVAAPCIGPFVLGLLTYVGERGDVILGFLLFFVLALGLGLPFLFLAIFSGSIDRLPRSGAWMVWVRTIFGFILIAMAIYFLQPLFPNTLIYHLALALTLFVGGIFMAWLEPTKLPGKVFPVIRNVVGLVFMILALVFAASGIQTYVTESLAEARASSGLAPSATEILWLRGTEGRLEQARIEGRPVFIDFYAEWCIPCKEMDHSTFVDPEVVAASREFMMLKVDLTSAGGGGPGRKRPGRPGDPPSAQRGPQNERLRNRFAVKGVPTYVWLRPDGSEITELREVGFIDKDEFLKKMKSVFEDL